MGKGMDEKMVDQEWIIVEAVCWVGEFITTVCIVT